MSTTSVKETASSLMKQIKVTDYRQQSKVKFPLLPALFAIVIAWCCNCKNAVEVSDFLSAKKKYLAQIIEGLSEEESMSHDTVLRLLKMVKISELHGFLTEFANKLASNQEETRCLSLDGQTPRAMIYEAEKGEKSPKDRRQYNKLYYVTLYDSTNKISLAQDEVQDKEIENKTANFGIVVFDLNQLKQTNDNYGHDIGDKLIVTAAKVISDVFKRSPVFRIGGDEFLAVLQHGDLDDCEELFVRLDTVCENTVIEEMNTTSISIARGFAMFETNKDVCFNDVFKRADNAMYENKRKNKKVATV